MLPKYIKLAGVLCSSVAFSAFSPAALGAEPAESAETIDTIIVTGTRQADRTAFSSLAPIDVVSNSAINSTSSEDLLDTIAQIVPSFKVQRLPMNDGLIYVRPATLRNLSSDHTLVLINGKRRHRSALLGFSGAQSADMATIPSFAIKRMEVLRDGASAQYGSDAIAGVINVILDDEPGYKLFGQYSEYYEGDGTNYRLGGRGGWELGDTGFLSLTAEYYDAARTSRSRQRPDAIDFQEANPDITLDNPVQNWGQPERDGLRLALNASMEVADSTNMYVFGTYNEGEGVSDFNWRNPESGVFNVSSVYPDFDLADLYPAGFSPQFGQKDKDMSIVAGVEGMLMNDALSWDLSIGQGANKIDYFLSNTINASLGPNSPTSFEPGTLEQRETNINLDFVYPFTVDFLAADANLAFGGERRKETYEITAGDVASYTVGPAAVDGLPSGSNGFFGIAPSQAGTFDQESYAAYVDLELPFTDVWTVGIAGRYEDYSQFGDTLNGKISTRFELTENLALRATASTGFRAPTPGQLFSERNSQGLDTNTLEVFTNGRYSPEGPVAAIINARADATVDPLTAEESENFTVGLAYRDANGFSASLDIYQINISDRFGSSQGFTLTDEERSQLVALGVTGAESIARVSFFQNDFDTRTRGLDLVLSKSFTVDQNTLNLTFSYNYNDTKVTGGTLEANETQRVRFEERLPQHAANLAATYTVGDLEFFGRVRYYGSWTDYSDNTTGDIFQKFGAEMFFDASASYRISETVSVRVGAENLFDTYPDEATFQANRGLIYSRNAPYDTDGGNYYIRLDVTF
ncbi:ligand-gated channel [Kordiimonas sediminis]|uniref:Ligand-gated channel n=1 Tax=Kordiimonas sediminis TaxID=1735581 RepID=A0A919ALE2_9PROT|nr:TonB-dependent receptor [Kordiimonas sediminis]GHF13343.1 ligand-gated channel [Kordiimonas sediminis]